MSGISIKPKLSWEYENETGHYVAWRNGYRISAIRDDCAENPFENWDGNWPIAIYCDRDLTTHDETGAGPLNPFNYFMQVHIAKALGTSTPSTAIDRFDAYDHDEPPPKYIHDADGLREAFECAFHDEYDSKKIGLLKELYDLAGIPAYTTTSTGYSQRDWAELLVVATPEARKAFGFNDPPAAGQHAAHVYAWWQQQLAGTADLWSAWAWGDVYGYVVEYAVYDEDGEIRDWQEVDGGSCWGFYGDDFDKSGLSEAALECVPDEPAPTASAQLEECAA
jgi:hypothetical protein